jgi:hypothetical protein
MQNFVNGLPGFKGKKNLLGLGQREYEPESKILFNEKSMDESSMQGIINGIQNCYNEP